MDSILLSFSILESCTYLLDRYITLTSFGWDAPEYFWNPKGKGIILNAFLSPLKHIKQLFILMFCDLSFEVRINWTHLQTDKILY